MCWRRTEVGNDKHMRCTEMQRCVYDMDNGVRPRRGSGRWDGVVQRGRTAAGALGSVLSVPPNSSGCRIQVCGRAQSKHGDIDINPIERDISDGTGQWPAAPEMTDGHNVNGRAALVSAELQLQLRAIANACRDID
jgi:hypothetical protein